LEESTNLSVNLDTNSDSQISRTESMAKVSRAAQSKKKWESLRGTGPATRARSSEAKSGTVTKTSVAAPTNEVQHQPTTSAASALSSLVNRLKKLISDKYHPRTLTSIERRHWLHAGTQSRKLSNYVRSGSLPSFIMEMANEVATTLIPLRLGSSENPMGIDLTHLTTILEAFLHIEVHQHLSDYSVVNDSGVSSYSPLAYPRQDLSSWFPIVLNSFDSIIRYHEKNFQTGSQSQQGVGSGSFFRDGSPLDEEMDDGLDGEGDGDDDFEDYFNGDDLEAGDDELEAEEA